MTPVNALSHHSQKITNEIITPVRLTNVYTRDTLDTTGIWDTGATNSVITKSTAEALGLLPISKATVRGVHGKKDVNVYYVEITLNNDQISLCCQVTESDELSDDNSVGMLIGMNIINMGDFSISNFEGKTVMTFRKPSIECIDYVQEIKESNSMLKKHLAMLAHGNDKCPCGSGKLWKNCHGKDKYINRH